MEFWSELGETGKIVLAAFVFTVLLVIAIRIYQFFRDRKHIKSVTGLKRGTASERELVRRLRQKGIPAVTLFHDLCIEKWNGSYSQIDLVMVTTEAIIVFEVKDFKGWIYGDGHRTTWTKTLNYGKIKNRFYNPIKQNIGHIKAIKNLHPQLKYVKFYSVVVFFGDCELKEINYVPEGTFIAKDDRVFDVLKEIKEENEPAHYKVKRAVIDVLQEAVKTGANTSIQERHIANIKNTVGKHRIYK